MSDHNLYISLFKFSLYYLFSFEVCLVCLLQLFFKNSSNSILSIKVLSDKCPQNSVFFCFNQKNFFRPIWSVIFCKINLCLDILTWLRTSYLGSLSLFSTSKSMYLICFVSAGSILIAL